MTNSKIVEHNAPLPNMQELCRRLYVELFQCSQQMRSATDEDGYPVWTQRSTVLALLAEAETVLTARQQKLHALGAATAEVWEAMSVFDKHDSNNKAMRSGLIAGSFTSPQEVQAHDEWVMSATPADFNARNWEAVYEGLRKAQETLNSSGVHHSWINAYVGIARQECQRALLAAAHQPVHSIGVKDISAAMQDDDSLIQQMLNALESIELAASSESAEIMGKAAIAAARARLGEGGGT